MMRLKIISLNLWNGGKLFDQARDFLLQAQADIMLLQEAYNGSDPTTGSRFQSVKLLTQAFPEYSYHFAPVYLDTREKEGEIDDGQLIISKFPLTETKNIFFDVPYGKYDQDHTTDFSNFPATLQTAVITIGSRHIKLLNVHGPVNLDGTQDSERRLKMKDSILAEIEGEHSVILGGDFNVQPHTATIQAIEAQLTNVFGDRLTTSFNINRKNLQVFPGYASSIVDMLFISPDLQVIKSDCPTVDISDHLPLIATLELPPETGV